MAQTVPYQLTAGEQELYEQLTSYVREEMNRAARLEKGRRNTVGFALTVLQRRLASSPEAIFRSLERRAARLDRLRSELLAGGLPAVAQPSAPLEIYDDLDEYSAEELEKLEDDVVDAATAAAGADVFFSHTEVLHGLNMGLDYRLAIVRVDPRGEQYDEVRYLARPFAGNEFGLGTDYQHTLSWPKSWARGAAPF